MQFISTASLAVFCFIQKMLFPYETCLPVDACCTITLKPHTKRNRISQVSRTHHPLPFFITKPNLISQVSGTHHPLSFFMTLFEKYYLSTNNYCRAHSLNSNFAKWKVKVFFFFDFLRLVSQSDHNISRQKSSKIAVNFGYVATWYSIEWVFASACAFQRFFVFCLSTVAVISRSEEWKLLLCRLSSTCLAV